MSILEQKFMERVPKYLREISRQLKIANQLHAIEISRDAPLEVRRLIEEDVLNGKG